MSDCVFCKIVSGEIPSPRVYEDEKIIVINDLNPGAPVSLKLPLKSWSTYRRFCRKS